MQINIRITEADKAVLDEILKANPGFTASQIFRDSLAFYNFFIRDAWLARPPDPGK
jgi:phage tail protein X